MRHGRLPSTWSRAKGTKSFDQIKRFIYNEPEAAHALLEKLSDAVVEYLNEKIRSGCDAVQIFDTWAGILSPADLDEFSLRYISYICDRLGNERRTGDRVSERR